MLQLTFGLPFLHKSSTVMPLTASAASLMVVNAAPLTAPTDATGSNIANMAASARTIKKRRRIVIPPLIMIESFVRRGKGFIALLAGMPSRSGEGKQFAGGRDRF